MPTIPLLKIHLSKLRQRSINNFRHQWIKMLIKYKLICQCAQLRTITKEEVGIRMQMILIEWIQLTKRLIIIEIYPKQTIQVLVALIHRKIINQQVKQEVHDMQACKPNNSHRQQPVWKITQSRMSNKLVEVYNYSKERRVLLRSSRECRLIDHKITRNQC